jgi:hypothetical protein
MHTTRKHKHNHNQYYTETSSELIEFIQKRSHSSSAGRAFHLSKIPKLYLSKLCRLIHHSCSHMPKYTVTDMESTMETFITEFTNTPEGKHIPSRILDKITRASSVKIGRRVDLKIHGRDIHLYFIVPGSIPITYEDKNKFSTGIPRTPTLLRNSRVLTNTLDISENNNTMDVFFDTCIRRAIVWLDIALRFSGETCANVLNCYFFFTDDTKHLPTSTSSNLTEPEENHTGGMGEPITQKNANTAFTWACMPSSKIVLFRFEEWFKVFIHESFHCFGLDFAKMHQTEEQSKLLSTLFPVCTKRMDFRIYETYCETWAETINALFISYYTNHTNRATRTMKRHTIRRHTLNISKIIKSVETLLRNERSFSIYQMVKVMRHHKFTYDELQCLEKQNTYSEETQVFSYYIVKPIFMYYLNEYIEWCYKHNERENTLYFVKTQENVQQYLVFLSHLIQKPEFRKAVLEEEHKQSRNPTSSTLVKTTLRMSLYELA